MPRTPEPARADGLLDAVIEHLLEHGCSNVTFRPLAKALGVSTYKLVYHFGTLEHLLALAIDKMERRQIQQVRAYLASAGGSTMGDTMKQYWTWFLRPENTNVFRVFIEANALSIRRPDVYHEVFSSIFRDSVAAQERMLWASGTRDADAEALASISCAAMWGLQLDYVNTLDAERTTAAAYAFAEMMNQQVASRSPPPATSVEGVVRGR